MPKYHDLQSNYHFQPVAIETTGVYGKSTVPFLSGLSNKLVDVSGDPRECQWLHQRLSLAVARGNAASILACVQVWSNFTCSFLAAFNVLITITAYHLPLYQCVAIAFQILVLSVRFIVPLVVQCYLLVHWLNILSIAWPMMRVQRGFGFNIAWNLWGLNKKKS